MNGLSEHHIQNQLDERPIWSSLRYEFASEGRSYWDYDVREFGEQNIPASYVRKDLRAQIVSVNGRVIERIKRGGVDSNPMPEIMQKLSWEACQTIWTARYGDAGFFDHSSYVKVVWSKILTSLWTEIGDAEGKQLTWLKVSRASCALCLSMPKNTKLQGKSVLGSREPRRSACWR